MSAAFLFSYSHPVHLSLGLVPKTVLPSSVLPHMGPSAGLSHLCLCSQHPPHPNSASPSALGPSLSSVLHLQPCFCPCVLLALCVLRPFTSAPFLQTFSVPTCEPGTGVTKRHQTCSLLTVKWGWQKYAQAINALIEGNTTTCRSQEIALKQPGEKGRLPDG